MAKKLMGCPGWLELSEDRTSFIFMPDRAEIVRKIFELSIAGLGGYTIARQLNAKTVPAFGPSPKWDQSTIHNLLRNRATIGEHQPRRIRNGKRVPEGDPIPNFYPAVIEESLFLAAQVARQKNLATGRGRKGRFVTNLFASIPTCAYCSSPIKFHSNGKAKSLICSKVINRRGCYRMGWSYRNFENSFLEFALKKHTDPMIKQQERDTLADLVGHIQGLSGPDVYDARMGIAIALKKAVSELKVASAGLNPKAGKPDARIRRDGPGRYFEITFRGGSAHIVFPASK
jgi:Recombinase